MKPSSLILVVLVLVTAGCATTPVIAPDRWVEDYDYQQDFNVYLKARFDESISMSRVPYVYVYADWCPPCRKLRYQAKVNPVIARQFVETQMFLLDFDKLRKVEKAPSYGGVPLIIPIESDGTLGPRGLNGIPWRSLPRDIAAGLCFFFEERRLTTSSLDRNCEEVSP